MSLLDRALAAMLKRAALRPVPNITRIALATPEGRALADLVEAAVADDGFTDQRHPDDEPMCWACGCTRAHASPEQGGCPVDAFREAVER